METFCKSVGALLLVLASLTAVTAQRSGGINPPTAIPTNTLLRIIRAEDQRRWDDNLRALLGDKEAPVRKRAALAIGRIGDERAVGPLVEALKAESNSDVRQMIAFAIGEIEPPAGTDALIDILADTREPGEVRARAVEALGKIGTALLSNAPAASNQTGAAKSEEDPRLTRIRVAIVDALKFEDSRRSSPDRSTILLGLTAVLRTKPEGAGAVLVRFLGYADPRIVADALNTMARLKLKDRNDEVRKLLTTHADPVVRANAARVLGAAEDKGAFDALLDRALHDDDLRVRVSAIRALGSLKDARAARPLTDRIVAITRSWGEASIRTSFRSGVPLPNQSELLELLTAIGNIEAARGGETGPEVTIDNPRRLSPRGIAVFTELAPLFGNPELHLAAVKINPKDYMLKREIDPVSTAGKDIYSRWTYSSSVAQGYRTLATLSSDKYGNEIDDLRSQAQRRLRLMLDNPRLPVLAKPEVIRAYASLKPADVAELARSELRAYDVVVRATSAEVLGELPPDETNARALIEALPVALRDKDLNDAVLAILDALAKQKSAEANDAIKTALDSPDHLVRQKAVALLKANGAGDFSNRIGFVNTRNTEADYRRAIARIGKQVRATLVTSKGQFTIEFLPEEAPLTVDNFIQLARRGYFNGVTFHRVVPNFVVQGGDPRGDGNGGPGYSIRCEVNEVPYQRAALGMALSGKDTGGSQWFVTHSPQPHLDGGYTVFGRVISGMEVVDRIVRGDTIRRVIVNER